MTSWTCPDCGRLFARARTSHECSPAMTVEEYFETGPPHERPVFEAVVARLEPIGPFTVEPVSVGIFLKNPRTFVSLRPMTRWVAVGFGLHRRATHPRITKKVEPYGQRFWHIANIAAPDQVDDDLVALFAEAYHDA